MYVCSIYGIYMHAIKLAGKVAKRRIKQDQKVNRINEWQMSQMCECLGHFLYKLESIQKVQKQ